MHIVNRIHHRLLPVMPRSATSGWRAVLGCLTALAALAGCAGPMPDRAVRMTRGYIYYLDGAGGGTPWSNWSSGVRQGFLDAGYDGAGEMFTWNTGWGVVADQDAGVDYKRGKAAQLAARIQQYRAEQPGRPVTLMGLSAGTAVAVYTLEALPPSCPVDDVVLLGASISADYDLTKALQRVRNRLYVFTSEKDAVLAFAVPIAGTADRTDSPSAGLRGFRMPARASEQTRAQYAKVAYVQWKPEFALEGNFGGHTDAVNTRFVHAYIAPLIMRDMARAAPPPAGATMTVRNPDYVRWASFGEGSWLAAEGVQVVDGQRQPIRIVARLVSKHEDKLVIERTYLRPGGQDNTPLRVQQFVAPAEIEPRHHPVTNPASKITRRPNEQIDFRGRSLDCGVETIAAPGEYPSWGRNVQARVHSNASVPGGLVRISLKAQLDGRPYEFDGTLVDFGVK